MRNCPKCGRGQLLFDRSPNRYKIIYYCNRCGEETVIHITQEEIEREEREELRKRAEKREEYINWYRNQRIYDDIY